MNFFLTSVNRAGQYGETVYSTFFVAYKTAYNINCKPPSDDLYAKLRPKVFFLVNLI